MQNWDSLQPANYEHNWYGGMFPIKPEPQSSPLLEHYINMKSQTQQQQHQQPMELGNSSLTSSPKIENGGNDGVHNFLDNNLNHHPMGFNPLTPPGLPNAIMPTINFNADSHQQQSQEHHSQQQPQQQQQQQQEHSQQTQNQSQSTGNFNDSSSHSQGQKILHSPQDSTNLTKIENSSLTPRNTPPMDITPPKSPKHPHTLLHQFMTNSNLSNSNILSGNNGTVGSNNNGSNINITDNIPDNDLISNSSEDTRFLESDDESIRMPIYNSHGKMKNYKCKHCGFLAITKVSFWNHVRGHMKPEKILQCPKCPFVTELKHHLEYHIRKHKNLKPFQCDKCNYSCVNKSMLNSHLKSHSSIYQYRCSDCDYATKYCHSFKLHLRKYDHKPGLVLDEDGSPNPSVVIDVYGTRRGPKTKIITGRSSNKRNESKLHSSPSTKRSLTHNSPHSQKSANSHGNSLKSHSVLPQIGPLKSELSSLLMNSNMHGNGLSSTDTGPTIGMGHSQNPISSLLPNTLANMLQQSRNPMSFFPYLNLNLQMIAAQQQAVLAQLSPRMRDAALHSFNNCNLNSFSALNANNSNNASSSYGDDKDCTNSINNNNNEDDDDDDDDDENDCDLEEENEENKNNNDINNFHETRCVNNNMKVEQNINDMNEKNRLLSNHNAMDLSQTTPTKLNDKQQHQHHRQNQKVRQNLYNLNEETRGPILPSALDEINTPTTINSPSAQSTANSRARKGRVLKLDSTIKDPHKDGLDGSSSIEKNSKSIADENTTSSTSFECNDENSEVSPINSSGNSDEQLSKLTLPSVNNQFSPSRLSHEHRESKNSTQNVSNPNLQNPSIFECKYCDIYFKDAVLYTIHMGYHSCDDVFKCNMCGEKCDGPVGLFVHMARNAHS